MGISLHMLYIHCISTQPAPSNRKTLCCQLKPMSMRSRHQTGREKQRKNGEINTAACGIIIKTKQKIILTNRQVFFQSFLQKTNCYRPHSNHRTSSFQVSFTNPRASVKSASKISFRRCDPSQPCCNLHILPFYLKHCFTIVLYFRCRWEPFPKNLSNI